MPARTTGLFRRGSAYYLRVLLPADHPLRTRYPNGRVVQSLGAQDHRSASRLALVKRAEILAAVPEATTDWTEPAPGAPLPAAPVAYSRVALTLSDVYCRWARSKRRSSDTVAACQRALKLYAHHTGDPPISTLTRAQGDSFRAWLLEQPTSSKTARDRLTWIKSLLKFAQQELEVLSRSPWAGLEIATRPATRRRPWTAEELSTLFSHEIWGEGRLPGEPKAGGTAAYWLPLLALYTGARCGELCQLRTSDITVQGRIPLMRITDESSDMHIKSEAGVRTVPIHSELVRLGFLDYAERQAAGPLWPDLPKRKGKPGGYFSAYFSELRRSLGFGPQVVFHSFRHNVRSQLAEAGVAETLIDRLLGHESPGGIGARVYTHIRVDTMSAAIGRLAVSTAHLGRATSPSP